MLCTGHCGKPAVLGHSQCMYWSGDNAHISDRITYGQDLCTGHNRVKLSRYSATKVPQMWCTPYFIHLPEYPVSHGHVCMHCCVSSMQRQQNVLRAPCTVPAGQKSFQTHCVAKSLAGLVGCSNEYAALGGTCMPANMCQPQIFRATICTVCVAVCVHAS